MVKDAVAVKPLTGADAEITTVFEAVTRVVVIVNEPVIWFGEKTSVTGCICAAGSLDFRVTEVVAGRVSARVTVPATLFPATTASLLNVRVNCGFNVMVTVCVVRPSVAVM